MAGARGTPKKQEAFIAALRQCGNVLDACTTSGVVRRTAYKWRTDDEVFAAAWEEALDEAADRMEQEAFRRAVEGTEKPVFGSLGRGMGSGEVGRVREYSDTLLIFLLKAARPEKFRERAEVQHGGSAHITVTYADLAPPAQGADGDTRGSNQV